MTDLDRTDAESDDSRGLARPFLDRITPADTAAIVDDPAVTRNVGVRPYYVTKGRTSSFNEIVGFETMVVVATMPSPYISTLRYEEGALVQLCREPQSIAEISAKLRLPIAVAKVLAGDLAAFGVLDVYAPPEDVVDDIELIDAVIQGLRQL